MTDKLEVLPVDREAAAAYLGYRDWGDATDYRLTGNQDREVERTVLAFACHRISSQVRPDGELASQIIASVLACVKVGENRVLSVDVAEAKERVIAALSSERIAPQPDTAQTERLLRWIDQVLERADEHGITEGLWLLADQWRIVRSAVAALSPDTGVRAQIVAWHKSEAQRLHEAAAKEGQKPEFDERYFRHLVGCSTTHAACAEAIRRGAHLASLTPSKDSE